MMWAEVGRIMPGFDPWGVGVGFGPGTRTRGFSKSQVSFRIFGRLFFGGELELGSVPGEPAVPTKEGNQAAVLEVGERRP